MGEWVEMMFDATIGTIITIIAVLIAFYIVDKMR